MSVKKLLCGAAVASLMIAAPAASALTFKPSVGSATVKIANELDLATTPLTGTLPELTVDTTTDLPVADDYKLTITLTGGATFNSFNPTTALSSSTNANLNGEIVSTGGSDTDTSVVVLFDVTTTALEDILLDIPVKVSSCDSNVSVTIGLTDASNNPIEGGSAVLTEIGSTAVENMVECGSAFSATIASDATSTDGIDSKFSLASEFKQFLVQANGGAGVADSGTAAPISILAVDVDTSFDKDLAGTAVGFADVDTADFNITFTDATGFAATELTVSNINGTQATTIVDTASPVFGVKVNPAADSIDTEIVLNLTGTVAPTVQQPVVSSGLLNLVAGFKDEPITITGNGADDLNLEGASFGPFDWVGDASKPTGNIFRVTGLKSAVSAAVTMTNSSEGVNGTWPLTLDAGKLSGTAATGQTEYVLTPGDIQAAVGSAYGRGDLTITFFTSENVDVDRLMSAGGVISAYGNSANGDD